MGTFFLLASGYTVSRAFRPPGVGWQGGAGFANYPTASPRSYGSSSEALDVAKKEQPALKEEEEEEDFFEIIESHSEMVDASWSHARPMMTYSDGMGRFSSNIVVGYDIMMTARSIILKALSSLQVEGTSSINICDYGPANGGTSMPIITGFVDAIKAKYGADKEIMVYYDDQPSTDFYKSFSNGIQDAVKTPNTLGTPGVYTASIVTNFFDKCFPAHSIHLGTSITSMHRLSRRPCMLSDTTHCLMAKDEHEVKIWRRQAATDWEKMLLARAHELVPGGQLVIVCLAVDDDGQSSGTTIGINNSVYERLTDHWKSMADEGKITQEEFRNTNFLEYFRSVKEFSQPFKNRDSPVSKAGLKLMSIKTSLVPCPFNTRWLANGVPVASSSSKGKAEAAKVHAEWFVKSIRSWSDPTFLSALDVDRPIEEAEQLIEQLHARYEADVASAPDEHGMDFVHAYIHIEKDDASTAKVKDMDESTCVLL